MVPLDGVEPPTQGLGNLCSSFLSYRGFSKKSGRKDLNLRPYGPEPYALPGCATPRAEIITYFLENSKYREYYLRRYFAAS